MFEACGNSKTMTVFYTLSQKKRPPTLFAVTPASDVGF